MRNGSIDSPFGPVSFTVDGGYVTLVRFAACDDIYNGADPLLAETARQLEEFSNGTRFEFDLPLAPAFSEFQGKIRDCMIAIPFGEMRTYGDLAAELGSASQAVGQACGANPIPIIVPCHRVVASGGRLGGFSGGDGAPTKKKLLNHEAIYAP